MNDRVLLLNFLLLGCRLVFATQVELFVLKDALAFTKGLSRLRLEWSKNLRLGNLIVLHLFNKLVILLFSSFDDFVYILDPVNILVHLFFIKVVLRGVRITAHG